MHPRVALPLRVLAAGLVLGLALLGAVACIGVLVLAVGWGLLLVLASVVSGLACLGARAALHGRRVRRSATLAVREAESWLQHSRGHAEGS